MDSTIVNALQGLKIDNNLMLKNSHDPGMDSYDSEKVVIVKPQRKLYQSAVPQGDEPKPSPRKKVDVNFNDGYAGLSTSKSELDLETTVKPLSSVFADETYLRTTSRVLAPPGGISNIFSDVVEEFRPSSRVLSRPGGALSRIFDEDLPIHSNNVNRRDPNQESTSMDNDHGKKQFSNANGSSFSHHDVSEVKVTATRRDPNQRSEDVQHDESLNGQGRRLFAGKCSESHFSSNNLVIDALSRPNSPSEDGSVAQRGDVRVEGVARRDPNARSEEGQTFRPSSRVLQRPGGKSNFSLY
jgi:hypothetical protein